MNKPQLKDINFGQATAPLPNVPELNTKVTEYAQQTNVPKLVHPVKKTRFHRFTVELPDYLIDDIKTRAKGKTMRVIVMQALDRAGFHINADDMKDDFRGRR
jgi:hypothetical protein